MNRLFLVAITGECGLFHLHGIRPRGYNPFVLLKTVLEKQGIKLNTRNRKKTFEFLEQVFTDNKIKLHPILAMVKKSFEKKAE